MSQYTIRIYRRAEQFTDVTLEADGERAASIEAAKRAEGLNMSAWKVLSRGAARGYAYRCLRILIEGLDARIDLPEVEDAGE